MREQSKAPLEKVDIRLAVTDSPPPGDLPIQIRCRFPKHNDSTASMCVYPGHITCYGCGKAIRRRMESLAFLLGWYRVLSNGEIVNDWRRAIGVAGKYTVESLDAYRERAAEKVRKDPLPFALAKAYHHMLRTCRSDRLEWLYDRGLAGSTIERFLIGHNGSQFTIPFFNDYGELLTIRFRRDEEIATSYFEPRDGKEHEIPKYDGIKGRNGLLLFGGWMLREAMDYVVVCEGELDCVRLWQEGIPAVSPTNGAGQLRHVARLLEPYPWLKRMWIASDQDEPGELGALELQVESEMRLQFDWYPRLRWPAEWGKDVTELYKGGHTLEEVGFSERGRVEAAL